MLEDDSYSYAYDAKGNRVSRTSKADGLVETYSYDSQNRLVGYTNGTTTASYAYDAMERRISKTVDGVQTGYIYDASMDAPLAHDDIVLEFSDQTLKRRWMHSDSVDEPIGFEEYIATSGVGSGDERAIYADRQGSVIWVTDPATGSVVAAYEYDGYGQITQTAGTLKQPYGYTGREYDAESGLYYYRARHYDAGAGVFVQSDPIGFISGTLGLYQYVEGNSFNLGDPTGLTSAAPAMFGTVIRASAAKAVVNNIGAALTGLLGQINMVLRQAAKVALPVVVSGSSAPDMPPPGDCKKEFVAKIHKHMKRTADKGYSCKRLPKGAVITRSIYGMRASEVYFWRSFLMNICYRGGNETHKTEAANARKSMMECFSVPTGAWP